MTGQYFLDKMNADLTKKLEEEGLYKISVLQSRLRQEGFASTKNSIYNLEKQGKILPASQRRMIRGAMWRLYTENRIEEIINQLKSLPQKRILS